MRSDHVSRPRTTVIAVLLAHLSFATPVAAQTVLGFTADRAFSNLGISVRADGDRIVAGAPGFDASAVEGGAVAVFARSSGDWMLDRIVEPPLPEAWARFGFSADVAGPTLVVGAPGQGGAGSALIFNLSGLTAEVITLSPADGATGDHYGASVAIDGDTIAVGAPRAGKVYLYTEITRSRWQLTETLSSSQPGDRFGVSVALDGSRLAVGMDEHETGGVVSGAVALYENSGQRWIETQILRADVQVEGALFGRAVDLEGEVVVVGAPAHAIAGSTTGACFAFRRDALSGQWNSEQILGAAEATSNSLFGLDVALRLGEIVVGAPGDATSNPRQGTLWHFTPGETSWEAGTRLEAAAGSVGDHLGRSVAWLDGLAIAGVPSDDINGSAAGSVALFTSSKMRPRSGRGGSGRTGGPLWGYDEMAKRTLPPSASTLTCSFDAWPHDHLGRDYLNISVKELDARFTGIEDLVGVLARSGADGIGTKVHWEHLEPEEGLSDWAPLDSLLGHFSGAGLEPLLTIRGTPQWASAEPTAEHFWLYPPASMTQWRAFVQRLVSRYGSPGTGQVRRWEVWNEPNVVDFYLGSVDDYIEVLNTAFAAIKELDPDAQVWAPAVTFHPWVGDETWTFLDRVVAEGSFDVLSVHLYFSAPDEFFTVLAEVRRRLDAAGRSHIPVAVTEVNKVESVIDCRNFSAAEDWIHATEVDQVVRCVAAAGADHVFWFKSTDRGQYCPAPWDDSRLRNGLVGDGWTEDPEYLAFQALASDLAVIFADGFETGDTGAWTSLVSAPPPAQLP